MQPLMSNSVHSAISLERDDLDDNEETDTSASSSLFVICPSSKPITLAWYPSKTIGQVKCELQARLGLLPSHYMLHIKGSKMLSEVFPVILVYLRKVRKQLSSNGYLSVWCCFTFPGLVLEPKIRYFAWNLGLYLAEKTQCWQCGDQICYQRLSQSFAYIKGRLGNTQVAMDVCPSNTTSHFLSWSGAPNWIFCLKIESWFW